MHIYLTRHGQTDLNKEHLMQGLTDAPLNDTGREQAKEAGKQVKGVTFDAVFASPLDRAIETASIIGHCNREDVLVDKRIIEVDFGRYEMKKYYLLGLRMSLYWALPEIFKAPRSVESIESMVNRSSEFLRELSEKNYNNVLIVCHGGIIRALSGYFENAKHGIKWRPKPHNCEIREYDL